MDHGTSRRGLVLVALVVAALGAMVSAMPAGAHPYVPRWYQYDKVVWHYGWRSNPTLVTEHDQWHRNHPDATWEENVDFHRVLRGRWRSMHFHGALAYRDGKATWYDGTGRVGACGVRLYGLYRASRTLPLRRPGVGPMYNGHHVFVRILDRGPFGDSSRILDLSPKAFGVLATRSTGVIPVRTVQLRKR
jgi:rare lipoprotein A (peptidoglycan hydrolase)